MSARPARFRYSDQHLTLDRARRPWRTHGVNRDRIAESDGALRDAMARGAQELRCSCRPVWPVDRPCARPKATPWHPARHGFKYEPDPRRAGDERLERPLRLHLLSPAVRVHPHSPDSVLNFGAAFAIQI